MAAPHTVVPRKPSQPMAAHDHRIAAGRCVFLYTFQQSGYPAGRVRLQAGTRIVEDGYRVVHASSLPVFDVDQCALGGCLGDEDDKVSAVQSALCLDSLPDVCKIVQEEGVQVSAVARPRHIDKDGVFRLCGRLWCGVRHRVITMARGEDKKHCQLQEKDNLLHNDNVFGP